MAAEQIDPRDEVRQHPAVLYGPSWDFVIEQRGQDCEADHSTESASGTGQEIVDCGGEMKTTRLENGMTVADLKRLISEWPETSDAGEPCEVWICDGIGLTNQAKEIMPLNLRMNESTGERWADFMILPG